MPSRAFRPRPWWAWRFSWFAGVCVPHPGACSVRCRTCARRADLRGGRAPGVVLMIFRLLTRRRLGSAMDQRRSLAPDQCAGSAAHGVLGVAPRCDERPQGRLVLGTLWSRPHGLGAVVAARRPGTRARRGAHVRRRGDVRAADRGGGALRPATPTRWRWWCVQSFVAAAVLLPVLSGPPSALFGALPWRQPLALRLPRDGRQHVGAAAMLGHRRSQADRSRSSSCARSRRSVWEALVRPGATFKKRRARDLWRRQVDRRNAGRTRTRTASRAFSL